MPASVRHRLWRLSSRLSSDLRVLARRVRYAPLLLRANRLARVPVRSWVTSLENRLPNSGATLITSGETPPVQPPAAGQVVKRSYGHGLEGLALDDALVFTDPAKHLSYIPLGHAFIQIGRQHFGRPTFSVLELGSGGGDFFSFLRALGIEDYLGVDLNPIAFRSSPYIRGREAHFRLLNLQEPIDFAARFDLVCCFEVLEHIREDKLDSVLATIRRHMGPASLFLGSASTEEDHDVHVTVKERSFWLDRFAAHGLVPDARHAAYERTLGQNHPFHWHPGNTSIFALSVSAPG